MADGYTEEDRGLLETIGRLLQNYRGKKKAKKAPPKLESKIGQSKLTGEDVYQNAMKLFPKEEEQLRHSPRVRSGF